MLPFSQTETLLVLAYAFEMNKEILSKQGPIISMESLETSRSWSVGLILSDSMDIKAWFQQYCYFYSDCKTIVDNLINVSTWISKFHVIMARCRDILPDITNSWWVLRGDKLTINNVAHILIKTSLFNACSQSFDNIIT